MADLNTITGGLTSGFSSFGTVLKYTLYAIPFIAIIWVIVTMIRNKLRFKYKVRVFRVRENRKVKESNFVGGYIGRKNSAPYFRIKTGRWWWQFVDLIETPKIQYMDEEDRIYYAQIDVNSYIQMKRVFDKELITFVPVESDIKYGAILSVQRIKEVLRTEPTWKKVLPYVGLVILAIVFIVAYAMLMNKCSGGA